MKRVHVSADPVRAGWLATVLEAAGIPCVLRNAYLGGAIGELPLNECWPELWVIADSDYEPACRLLEEAEAPGGTGAAWTCAHCGEAVDGEFAACWHCGEPVPAP